MEHQTVRSHLVHLGLGADNPVPGGLRVAPVELGPLDHTAHTEILQVTQQLPQALAIEVMCPTDVNTRHAASWREMDGLFSTLVPGGQKILLSTFK